MSYQVFARKYRPQTFDEVIGQEHVTRTLKNAIEQNRLAHAYLFVGPRGIGKTSTARILAKALNCEQGPTASPCNVCDNCREIAMGTSLDVLEIDGASNNGVEQVRELRDNVRFSPARGNFRIYIIDEVHMLTAQAFNALLKTLEEPPPHVKFIFATTEPQKVLATILSRCQRFDLRRIPAGLIAAHLTHIASEENIELEDAAALAIAKAAEGGLRDAESMLDQLVAFCGDMVKEEDVLNVFGLTGVQTTAQLAAAIFDNDTPGALELVNGQQETGKDLSRLLTDLVSFLRNLIIFEVTHAAPEEEDRELLEPLAGRLSREKLLGLIDVLAEAEGRMRWAPNKQIHFEVAIIRVIQSLNQAGLEDVLETLNALREGRPLPASGPRRTAPTPRPKPAVTPAPSPRREKSIPAPEKQSASPESERPSGELAAPVRETAAEEAASEPEPAATEASGTSEPQVDPEDLEGLWKHLLSVVRRERPLIVSWLEQGTPLAATPDRFTLGFPAGAKIAADALNRGATRKFLEAALAKLTGKQVAFKTELSDELSPASAVAAPRETDEPDGETEISSTDDDFRNDPLIKKALDLFEAELETTNQGNV